MSNINPTHIYRGRPCEMVQEGEILSSVRMMRAISYWDRPRLEVLVVRTECLTPITDDQGEVAS